LYKKIFQSKIALVLFGILMGLVLLESGLRIAGFLVQLPNRLHIYKELKAKKELTILCLGESTTQGQWPAFLEESFHRYKPGVKLTVIDEGLGGTTTTVVASRIAHYLDRYKPDIVVTMMGINDLGDTLLYDDSFSMHVQLFFSNIRIYKLARLLIEHVRATYQDVVYAEELATSEEARIVEIIRELRTCEEYELIIKELNTLSRTIPAESKANELLGDAYSYCNELEKAEEKYLLALRHHPTPEKYVKTALLMMRIGHELDALELLHSAAKLYPARTDIACALGENYEVLEDMKKAEEMYIRALEYEPTNARALECVVRMYIFAEENAKAYKLLENYAYDTIPIPVQTDLARMCFYEGKYDESIVLYETILTRVPYSLDAFAGLALNYEKKGNLPKARYYWKKVKEYRMREYSPVTRHNYNYIKKVVEERGCQLVCMQYPMRDSAPLKKLFYDPRSVIFVDNEKNFRTAVENEGYKIYFRDIFATDFGHCTDKGNRLIADTLIQTLMKEYFSGKKI
jgi:lysophospholipase L1-like esterase/Tfp pilus assembly protein PilF